MFSPVPFPKTAFSSPHFGESSNYAVGISNTCDRVYFTPSSPHASREASPDLPVTPFDPRNLAAAPRPECPVSKFLHAFPFSLGPTSLYEGLASSFLEVSPISAAGVKITLFAPPVSGAMFWSVFLFPHADVPLSTPTPLCPAPRHGAQSFFAKISADLLCPVSPSDHSSRS